MRSTFRVLSLDGGGARGFLSAKILSNIEKALALRGKDSDGGSPVKPLGEYFDLIVGTSTGAILAAGLGIGLSAGELVSIYREGLPEIFRKPSCFNPLSWKGPTYSADLLRSVLSRYFDDHTINDVKTDVCLVAVSLVNGQPRLYKSTYLDRNRGRSDERLMDIIVASAAAPTFFKPVGSLRYSTLLVDGGLCANNPAMIGLIDARQVERPSRSRQTPPPEAFPGDITLLSVGTGEREGLPFDARKLENAGKFGWVKPNFLRAWATGERPAVPIIELMMESQVRLVEKQVEFLMKGGNYLRINPKLDRSYPLDDVDHLEDLLHYADLDADAHEWVMANLAEQNDRCG